MVKKTSQSFGELFVPVATVALVIALVVGVHYGLASLLQWALWHVGVKEAAAWNTWAVVAILGVLSTVFGGSRVSQK